MLFRGPQKIVDFSYDPKGALGRRPNDPIIVQANDHSIPVEIGYRNKQRGRHARRGLCAGGEVERGDSICLK